MIKMKQIALICLVAFGLFSCESEKIDETSTNDTLVGEKILRFDLNGQTRIARGNEITVKLAADSSLMITAIVKDRYNDYKPVVFQTTLSHLSKGNFVTDTRAVDPLKPLYATASFKYPEASQVYSTQYAPESIFAKGNLIVEKWQVNSQQIEGYFTFDVYPKPVDPDQGGTPTTPLRISNGYFKYFKY